jgi:phage shock protein C
MYKKLFLSDANKKIAGVCGGIGDYFEVDPTLVRLIWVVITLMTWGTVGIIGYIIAWAVIPRLEKY